MLTAPTPPPTANLGRGEHGVPVIGLMPAVEGWCEEVSTDHSRRVTQTVDEWKNSWKVFDEAVGCPAQKVTEHFDTVTFTRKKDSETQEMEFAFLVDNSKDTRKEYAVIYIYSTQDKRIVFSGHATPPGSNSKLLRYEHADKAFCLRKSALTPQDTGTTKLTPNEAHTKVCDADVCAFTVLVTQAEEVKNRRPVYVEYDGHEGSDSDSGCDAPDGGLHHTNIIEGGRTGQRFDSTSLEHKGAPVHIYNVTVLLQD